jgi:hypothetical protein
VIPFHDIDIADQPDPALQSYLQEGDIRTSPPVPPPESDPGAPIREGNFTEKCFSLAELVYILLWGWLFTMICFILGMVLF